MGYVCIVHVYAELLTNLWAVVRGKHCMEGQDHCVCVCVCVCVCDPHTVLQRYASHSVQCSVTTCNLALLHTHYCPHIMQY